MVVWVAWLQLGSSRRGLSWLQQDARGSCCIYKWAALHAWASGGTAGIAGGWQGLSTHLTVLMGDSATITALFISHCGKFIPPRRLV